ncbi:MAG: tol-pal system protein YbgF [Desulfovibrio sp.]|nr:tol-pal system protein YbgF [Desulfovibrio sp.]
MRKRFIVPVACLVLSLTGCASSGQVQQLEESNQRQARDAEYRLKALESSVAALSGQIAQLDNRVYEVRNRSGRKTGMTAVPTTALTAAAPTASGEKNRVSAPVAEPVKQSRPARPAKASTPPQKKQQEEKTAGPSGQIGRTEVSAGVADQPAAQAGRQSAEKASAPVSLALPPMEDPATSAAPTSPNLPPVTPRASDAREVPVPGMAALGIALPPEQPATAAQSAVPAAPAAADVHGKAPKNSPAAARGEAAAYKHALKQTRSGHLEEGIASFRELLQNYPKGRYAANAQYWIGEALYAQGKFSEALAQFQNVSTSYPQHHKSADALLKAGMSLSRMGDRQGATTQYKELLTRFPNSDAARLVRARGLAR